MAERIEQSHAELEAQNAELRESERMKTELVSIVSHELRTPLASVLGFTALLLKREFDPPIREALPRDRRRTGAPARRAARGLPRRPADRARGSRAGDRDGRPRRASRRAGGALRGTEPASTRSKSRSRNARCLCAAIRTGWRRSSVTCSRTRSSTRLTAARSSSQQSGAVTGVRVIVRDEGLGIPEDQQERIFTKFFRGDAGATGITGTGLGLAVSREIVEAHGGSIGFDSDPVDGLDVLGRAAGSRGGRNGDERKETPMMKTKTVYAARGGARGHPRREPLGGELGGRHRPGHDPDHERQDTVPASTSAAKGKSPGDMEIIRQKLYNRRVTTSAIGRSELICTFVDRQRSRSLPRHVLPAEGQDRRRRVAPVPAVLRARRPRGHRALRQRPRHARRSRARACTRSATAWSSGSSAEEVQPLGSCMTPDRDAILRALEHVIDPELRKPVTELDMVRELEIEGGAVSVTIALTVAGCPLRNSFQEQVAEHVGGVPGVERVELRFGVMTPEEKSALTTKLRGGRPREVDLPRPANARGRHRERQGRRRQVVPHRQPRSSARRARPAGRRDRCGHLRPLDPAHARRPPAPDRGRQDDRAAGPRPAEADLDRQLPRRQRSGDVARADAPPRARAVPLGRPLGRARHDRRRHAARHRRHGDLARPAASARRGAGRDDAAAARAGGGRPRRDDGAEDWPEAPRRGGEHERRGLRDRAAAGSLADDLGVPLLGTVPLDTALREAGDAGVPVVEADPESESARAIVAIAEAVLSSRPGAIRKPLTVLS